MPLVAGQDQEGESWRRWKEEGPEERAIDLCIFQIYTGWHWNVYSIVFRHFKWFQHMKQHHDSIGASSRESPDFRHLHQEKKRKKSESPGGTRKRKSKWGPDTASTLALFRLKIRAKSWAYVRVEVMTHLNLEIWSDDWKFMKERIIVIPSLAHTEMLMLQILWYWVTCAKGGFSMSAMPGGRSGLLPAAEADELMLGPQKYFFQLCVGEEQTCTSCWISAFRMF